MLYVHIFFLYLAVNKVEPTLKLSGPHNARPRAVTELSLRKWRLIGFFDNIYCQFPVQKALLIVGRQYGTSTSICRARQLGAAGRGIRWVVATGLHLAGRCFDRSIFTASLKAKFHYAAQLAGRSQTSSRPNRITLSSLRPARELVSDLLASKIA